MLRFRNVAPISWRFTARHDGSAFENHFHLLHEMPGKSDPGGNRQCNEAVIRPASEYSNKRHAGLDPASSPHLDSGFRRNDEIEVFKCRSNKMRSETGQMTMDLNLLMQTIFRYITSHFKRVGLSIEQEEEMVKPNLLGQVRQAMQTRPERVPYLLLNKGGFDSRRFLG